MTNKPMHTKGYAFFLLKLFSCAQSSDDRLLSYPQAVPVTIVE